MRRSLALALVAACSPWEAAAPPPAAPVVVAAPVPASIPAQPSTPSPAETRLALFDALVAEVRAVHQLAPSTWENLAPLTFPSALPELREAFGAAATEAELIGALVRLGNALHDVHLGFRPAAPFRAHLTLPVVVTPEWEGGQAWMVVTESRAPGVDAGDVVTSYAGTPASELLRRYADRSSANQWRGVALGVAAWMTERPADAGDGVDGGTVTLGLHKRYGTDAFVNLTWSRGGWHGAESAPPATPDYDQTRCAPGLPTRRYPTYRLASHGTAYCLYLSPNPRYAPYPVLRLFSFEFPRPFDAEAEHEHLARALRPLPDVRGLILDLRDSAGGSDPKWVLDWFAPRPYLDLRTQVKKTLWLDTIVVEDVANLDDGWVNALARAPEGALVSRFLGCRGADCTDTRQLPAHRILPVPAALLVGPACNGACDRFARLWDENGLGPIVGEPSGAALTALRVDLPVALPGGRKLGSLRLALSLDYSPLTGRPVEGLPIHVDVPVAWTWATRDTYESAMVDAAVRTLRR